MRRVNLLAIGLLAALASVTDAKLPPQGAQATPTAFAARLDRLGGTFLYDPQRGRPVAALTYEVSRLTGVLGTKVDLSLCGVAGVDSKTLTLGTAELYQRSFPLTLSSELRGTASVALGPALLYDASGGNAHLGAVGGLSFRF